MTTRRSGSPQSDNIALPAIPTFTDKHASIPSMKSYVRIFKVFIPVEEEAAGVSQRVGRTGVSSHASQHEGSWALLQSDSKTYMDPESRSTLHAARSRPIA